MRTDRPFTFRVQPTNQEVRIQTEATICNCRRLDAKSNGHAALTYGAGIRFDGIPATEQVMLQHYLYEAENSLLH